jgi:hypothetical protein
LQIGTFRRGDRRPRLWKAEKRPRVAPFRALLIGDTRLSPILARPNASGCPMTTASAFRQREWRRRRRESWRQYCASCESIFVPSRRDAIFCSAAAPQFQCDDFPHMTGTQRPSECATVQPATRDGRGSHTTTHTVHFCLDNRLRPVRSRRDENWR